MYFREAQCKRKYSQNIFLGFTKSLLDLFVSWRHDVTCVSALQKKLEKLRFVSLNFSLVCSARHYNFFEGNLLVQHVELAQSYLVCRLLASGLQRWILNGWTGSSLQIPLGIPWPPLFCKFDTRLLLNCTIFTWWRSVLEGIASCLSEV